MDLTPLYMLVDIAGSDTSPWDPGINYTYPEIACQPIQGEIGESDILWLCLLVSSCHMGSQHLTLCAPTATLNYTASLLSSDEPKPSDSQDKFS